MNWRICFEAEQQGRGRQERGGVKELDGLKHLLKCKNITTPSRSFDWSLEKEEKEEGKNEMLMNW